MQLGRRRAERVRAATHTTWRKTLRRTRLRTVLLGLVAIVGGALIVALLLQWLGPAAR